MKRQKQINETLNYYVEDQTSREILLNVFESVLLNSRATTFDALIAEFKDEVQYGINEILDSEPGAK